MNILTLILVVICLVILAWNFYPPLRERLRGWSTIAEGIIGTVLYYFGVFSEAISEAEASGYVPEGWQQYIPFVLLAWIVVKRLQTKTPVPVME